MSKELNPLQSYTYTITVPNFPNLKLGDLVKVIANEQKLTDLKEVNSIKVIFNTQSMPRIRTELGLGELAPDIQLKKGLQKLRQEAKKETTSFTSSAIPITDEIYYEWDT